MRHGDVHMERERGIERNKEVEKGIDRDREGYIHIYIVGKEER